MERELSRQREPEPQQEAHYEIQLRRRRATVVEWNKHRKTIARMRDTKLEYSPTRGTRQAMMIGTLGDFPTRIIDGRVVEILPGSRTSTHRHTAEMVMFIVSGKGYSMVNGERYDWEEKDSLHIPTGVWHSHHNLDPDNPASYVSWTNAPLLETLLLNDVEDMGDAPKNG